MHHDPLNQKKLSICQSLLTELTRQMTLPTENGNAAPPVEPRESCQSVNFLTASQNLVSFPVLRHIEPQAPLLVVPAQSSSKTGTALIAVAWAIWLHSECKR